MSCAFCGMQLPAAADFCSRCGRPWGDDSAAAGRQPRDLPQLMRLCAWPERFVREMRALLPGLSIEKQLDLERACWLHVNATLGMANGIDLELLERRLAANLPVRPRAPVPFDPD
jgi:hypothetical protein